MQYFSEVILGSFPFHCNYPSFHCIVMETISLPRVSIRWPHSVQWPTGATLFSSPLMVPGSAETHGAAGIDAVLVDVRLRGTVRRTLYASGWRRCRIHSPKEPVQRPHRVHRCGRRRWDRIGPRLPLSPARPPPRSSGGCRASTAPRLRPPPSWLRPGGARKNVCRYLSIYIYITFFLVTWWGAFIHVTNIYSASRKNGTCTCRDHVKNRPLYQPNPHSTTRARPLFLGRTLREPLYSLSPLLSPLFVDRRHAGNHETLRSNLIFAALDRL